MDTELVREDPPRALPESYNEIKVNIERVRATANANWYRVAKLPRVSQAHNRRLVLARRPEYKLFEFRAGKLDPPDPEFEAGLWCKWVGQRKGKQKAAIEDFEQQAGSGEEEPRRLRAVHDHPS